MAVRERKSTSKMAAGRQDRDSNGSTLRTTNKTSSPSAPIAWSKRVPDPDTVVTFPHATIPTLTSAKRTPARPRHHVCDEGLYPFEVSGFAAVKALPRMLEETIDVKDAKGDASGLGGACQQGNHERVARFLGTCFHESFLIERAIITLTCLATYIPAHSIFRRSYFPPVPTNASSILSMIASTFSSCSL